MNTCVGPARATGSYLQKAFLPEEKAAMIASDQSVKRIMSCVNRKGENHWSHSASSSSKPHLRKGAHSPGNSGRSGISRVQHHPQGSPLPRGLASGDL